MELHFSLRVHGGLRMLPLILNTARDFAQVTGASDATGEQLGLAAEEICSNIFLYAYEDKDNQGPLKLEGRMDKGHLELDFLHRGDPLKESDLPNPDLAITSGQTGGMGLVLAQRAADELQLIEQDGWAGIRLVRTLELRPVKEGL